MLTAAAGKPSRDRKPETTERAIPGRARRYRCTVQGTYTVPWYEEPRVKSPGLEPVSGRTRKKPGDFDFSGPGSQANAPRDVRSSDRATFPSMRDKIRAMVHASSPTNRLASSNGMTVVISTPSQEQISRGNCASGPTTVCFASSEDATLFYHAGPVIVSLCDELDQAELRQRPGVIEELQSQIQTAKNERDAARAETVRLETLVSQLLEREEKLSELAKFGRSLQPKYVALFDKAQAMQKALDAARARAVSLQAEIERAGKA